MIDDLVPRSARVARLADLVSPRVEGIRSDKAVLVVHGLQAQTPLVFFRPVLSELARLQVVQRVLQDLEYLEFISTC